MNSISHRQRLLTTTLVGAAALALSGQALAQTATSGPAPGAEDARPSTTAPVAAPTGASSAPVNAPAGQSESSPVPIGTPQAAGGQPSGAGTTVQEVTVTGSRIRQPGLTSTSPITVVNSQELKLEGTTNVETLLNNLPQAFAAQTSQVSNGATGTAQANLRNLGAQRTLVLVNGKRLEPGDPRDSIPDLNNIPAAMVDRIDVVTGGASAVYGSDAVAGVVNFILKKDFEGVQLDAQYGFYNHQQGNGAVSALSAFGLKTPGDVGADGFQTDVSAIIGANAPDGKGNVTAYVSYRNLQPVLQSTRDFSACGLSTTGVNLDTHICQGSSNTAYGRFQNPGLNPALKGDFANNPNGSNTFVPYTGALAFNFAPFNYLQREDDRYTAGFNAHYQINSKIDVYSEFMFADDHTIAQIAPSGLFRGTGAFAGSTFNINCDNPLLGPTQAAALCGANAGVAGKNYTGIVGYRFPATNPRQDDLRHTDYKVDIGARGELIPGWTYDAYLQYGTSVLSERYNNDVSTSRTQNALQVVNVNGVPTCTSVVNKTDLACVPLNIFSALGAGITPAARSYVSVPGLEEGQTVEQIAHAEVSGDLGRWGIRSPFANDGVGVAFGTEYRRESLTFQTDQEFATGDLAGQGGPRKSQTGHYDLYEVFAETRVPLIQDKPFIKELVVDGGFRYSDYQLQGNTIAYKGEFDYSLTSDIRLRAGYNKAVRAPNAVELFLPQSVALGSFQDPCSTDAGAGRASQAACANTGLNAAQYAAGVPGCPSAQCSILVGGNTSLKPEQADTYTAGLVFTPRFIKGFSGSLDYFDIKVNNLVGTIPANTSLTQCLSGQQALCGLIHRDPATGILFGSNGYITQTNVNTGFLATQGFDAQASYKFRIADVPYAHLPDLGSIVFSYEGTLTTLFQFEAVPGLGSYNCAGKFGQTCGFPQPHYRHEFRTSWVTPYNATLSLNWRHLGDALLDLNSTNPILSGGPGFNDKIDGRIGNYDYFDLTATWRVKDAYTIRVGVNNLFDRDPPIVDSNAFPVAGPPFGNGNTYPGVYDSLGRTIFVGLTANF